MKKARRSLLVFFILIAAIQTQQLQAQDRSTRADSLLAAGNELVFRAEYEEASYLFKEAMHLYLQAGDSVKWAEATLEYGETLVDQGRGREGLEQFEKVRDHQPEGLSVRLQSRIFNDMGWANRRLENIAEAERNYLKGLELAETAGDSLMIARLNSNLGNINRNRGNYEKAIQRYNKSISIYERLEDTYRLSITLNNKYIAYLRLGLLDKGAPYLKRSMRLHEELNNPDLRDLGFNNMAWLYRRLGKNDSALIYFKKSLDLSREVNNPYNTASRLMNIGWLYENTGEYDKAMRYFREALQMNRQTGRPYSISFSLNGIATTFRSQGLSDSAEVYYKKALSYLDEEASVNHRIDLYTYYADLLRIKGDYKEALEMIQKGLDIANTTQQLHLLRGQGHVYRDMGLEQQALNKFRSAYQLSKPLYHRVQIKPAMELAQAFQVIGSDSAFYYAQKSFDLVEEMKSNVSGLTFRGGLFGNYAEFYKEVASWYIDERDDAVSAFKWVEAAKAQVLLDQLAEAREASYSVLDEQSMIQKEQKVKAMDDLYNRMQEEDDKEKKKALQNELNDLEFEYEAFLNQVRLENDKVHDFPEPEYITADKVQGLLDNKTAVLEYAFSGDALLCFIITAEGIEARKVEGFKEGKTAVEMLKEEVTAFREAIENKASEGELAIPANSLYRSLIKPFADENPEISNLLVVPEGILSFAPFEAFITDEGQYLIGKFNIKYLPSMSIYPYIRNPHETKAEKMLALAGTGFDNGLVSNTRSQNNYASLPAAVMEVDSIAGKFEETAVLKNEELTEARLKSFNLGDFRYLHFATHGSINEKEPSRSGLVLSKQIENEKLFGEDGYLNSIEISNLNLKADMVVLSSCNTGIGKFLNGEGLLGLQRSFLAAGASAVTVSLWSVYDQSTAVFMDEYYTRLLNQEKQDYGLWSKMLNTAGWYEHPIFDYKAKALQQAKIEMINHPYYHHPVYWAPFILIGK